MAGLAGQRGGRPSLLGLMGEALNQGIQGTMEWLGNRRSAPPATDVPPAPLRRDYGSGVPFVAPEEWPEEWGAPPGEMPAPEDDGAERPGIILTPPGSPPAMPGSGTSAPPAPSPGEHVGDPQPQPPMGGAPASPTTQVDARMEQELARKSREDDECQECERCDFLRDGEFAMKNYGGNQLMVWAMKYQHHVIHWQPHIPSARQIQEFDIADASARGGKRAMDGLAIHPCFLIEAKLGYSKYLRQDWERGKVVWRDTPSAERAMKRVTTQISSHHSIAAKYQRKYSSEHDHNVIWVVSNSLMELCLREHALQARISTRIWVYLIKAPASLFSREPEIGENEVDEESQ